MKLEAVSGITLTLLITGMLSGVFTIQSAKAESLPCVYVDPATGTANPGETFIINITVGDVPGLKAWEIKIRWNLSVLAFPPTITEGPFLSQCGTTEMYVNPMKILETVQIGVVLLEDATVSGSGTLATLEFQVMDTGNCTLELWDTILYDINWYPITHTTENGYFYTKKPFASFIWTPAEPDVGDVVTFDASASYDPDGGTIVSYDWDFGDGDTGTGMIVNHTYTTARYAPYIVSLTVTDDEADEWVHSEELRIWHDVTIVDIWPSIYVDVPGWWFDTVDYEVRRGEEVWILVTAVNEGTVTETFNVTLYADLDLSVIGDEITIDKIEVIVAAGKASGWVLIYEWNTTEVLVGDYTITALADAVPGETETGNNMLSTTVTILPAEYTLTVYSLPVGVTFAVDGVSHTTRWSGIYSEDASVNLVMPETHNGYVWSQWLEDGDPNRIKTATMETNITLTAVYEPAPKPVGGKATPISMPINKAELQTPWIWLITIILSLVLAGVYVKKKKKYRE